MVTPSIHIPDYWSAEQALAVYEFLLDLQQQIWDRYELQLYELLRPDLDEMDRNQLDLFDFNRTVLIHNRGRVSAESIYNYGVHHLCAVLLSR